MAILPVSTAGLADLLGLPAGSTATLGGSSVSAGVSNASLAGFAGTVDRPFLILSSGVASQIAGPNLDGGQGVDLGLEGITGDSVTITFTIPKPVGARGFSLDFTFLSEEIAEFVGSEFDDFLSIKINGTESALDTDGGRITVNNDFFDSPFTPEGTIFDGQTPLLRVIAPLSDALDTVTVSITVADVGDGLYDSAAFVSGFRFVEPQLVYLQFDGGDLDFSSFLNTTGFDLPGSGLTGAEQDQVVAAQNAIYADFLIEFTKTRPASGDYSTVHVGGVVADLPSYLDATTNLLGRAEKIDYGNLDKSDSAFVLSGEFALVNGRPDLALLSQVIAHEAGHILGLRHVRGAGELLQPFADPANTIIGGPRDLAEIDQATGQVVAVGGVQDSRAELESSLGLAGLTNVIIADGVFDRTLKLFSFDAKTGTNPLFRAIVAVANSENEVLSFTEVGTVAGNGLIEVLLPATGRDKVVLLARSSENSGYDIFATLAAPVTFEADAASEEAVLNVFGVEVAQIDSRPLDVVRVGADGGVTTIGTVTVLRFDAGDGIATDGADVLMGGQRVADTLIGLGGDDRISGLGGADRLFGNSGRDLLDGGGGDDILAGGEGGDVFLFGTDARGADRISDFGADDFLVTTTKLVDKNNDGLVDFGRNRTFDIPFRSKIDITSESGATVRRLEFDGAFTTDDTVYYVYSLFGSNADPAGALANL